jgi:hypothetical protein
MSCNMPSNYTTKVHPSFYNSCDYGRHAHHQTFAHNSTPIWLKKLCVIIHIIIFYCAFFI